MTADRCEAKVLVKDMRMSVTQRCELPADHLYEHRLTLDACEPPAQMRWTGTHDPVDKATNTPGPATKINTTKP